MTLAQLTQALSRLVRTEVEKSLCTPSFENLVETAAMRKLEWRDSPQEPIKYGCYTAGGHATCFGAQFNRPNKLDPTTPTAVALLAAPCAASIIAELHTALPSGQTAQTSYIPRLQFLRWCVKSTG